jgi:hypothetical protein
MFFSFVSKTDLYLRQLRQVFWFVVTIFRTIESQAKFSGDPNFLVFRCGNFQLQISNWISKNETLFQFTRTFFRSRWITSYVKPPKKYGCWLEPEPFDNPTKNINLLLAPRKLHTIFSGFDRFESFCIMDLLYIERHHTISNGIKGNKISFICRMTYDCGLHLFTLYDKSIWKSGLEQEMDAVIGDSWKKIPLDCLVYFR